MDEQEIAVSKSFNEKNIDFMFENLSLLNFVMFFNEETRRTMMTM